jgi:hypothetical protein
VSPRVRAHRGFGCLLIETGCLRPPTQGVRLATPPTDKRLGILSPVGWCPLVTKNAPQAHADGRLPSSAFIPPDRVSLKAVVHSQVECLDRFSAVSVSIGTAGSVVLPQKVPIALVGGVRRSGVCGAVPPGTTSTARGWTRVHSSRARSGTRCDDAYGGVSPVALCSTAAELTGATATTTVGVALTASDSSSALSESKRALCSGKVERERRDSNPRPPA